MAEHSMITINLGFSNVPADFTVEDNFDTTSNNFFKAGDGLNEYPDPGDDPKVPGVFSQSAEELKEQFEKRVAKLKDVQG